MWYIIQPEISRCISNIRKRTPAVVENLSRESDSTTGCSTSIWCKITLNVILCFVSIYNPLISSMVDRYPTNLEGNHTSFSKQWRSVVLQHKIYCLKKGSTILKLINIICKICFCSKWNKTMIFSIYDEKNYYYFVWFQIKLKVPVCLPFKIPLSKIIWSCLDYILWQNENKQKG